MADWSNPQIGTQYTSFLDYLKARDEDAAKLFDNTGTNLPVGTIRWSSSNNRFEKFNGTDWVELTAQYNINASTISGASLNDNGTTASDIWSAAKIISELDLKANTSLNNVSDSTILTKIKNVDGAGSGLDADLLDGLNSNTFVRKDVANSMTGSLNWTNSQTGGWGGQTGAPAINVNDSDVTGLNALVFNDVAETATEGVVMPAVVSPSTLAHYATLNIGSDRELYIYPDASQTTKHKIYHTGNDSDLAKKSGTLDQFASGTDGDNIIFTVGRDLRINAKRALVGFASADGNKLFINYANDFANGVDIGGETTINNLIMSKATPGFRMEDTNAGFESMFYQVVYRNHWQIQTRSTDGNFTYLYSPFQISYDANQGLKIAKDAVTINNNQIWHAGNDDAIQKAENELTGSVDFDTIVKPGNYRVNTSGNAYSNTPETTFQGTLVVNGASPSSSYNVSTQILFSFTSNKVYCRTMWGIGNWTEWKEVVTKGADWHPISLLNGHTGSLFYCKIGSAIYLKGVVNTNNATSEIMGVLPSTAIPSYSTTMFIQPLRYDSTGFARIQIVSDGTINLPPSNYNVGSVVMNLSYVTDV